MNEHITQRINELVREKITIVSYDFSWPQQFADEKEFLESILPKALFNRIEHFGSTAVSGLSAKPIIDMIVEVTSLKGCKKKIVPLLVSKGYEYFWRPTFGDQPPYYVWFIKRNKQGLRTHHIHMVEQDSPLWDALLFRDYLRKDSEGAKRYEQLKHDLAKKYEYDRVSYTKEKTQFIKSSLQKAKFYVDEVNFL